MFPLFSWLPERKVIKSKGRKGQYVSKSQVKIRYVCPDVTASHGTSPIEFVAFFKKNHMSKVLYLHQIFTDCVSD